MPVSSTLLQYFKRRSKGCTNNQSSQKRTHEPRSFLSRLKISGSNSVRASSAKATQRERSVHIFGVSMFSRKLWTADGLKFEELDETLAVEIIAKTGWMGERSTYPALIVKRFVRFLCERGVAKAPNPPTAKEAARDQLRRGKGLAATQPRTAGRSRAWTKRAADIRRAWPTRALRSPQRFADEGCGRG